MNYSKLTQGTVVPVMAAIIIALLWLPSLRADHPAFFAHNQTTPTTAKYIPDTHAAVAHPAAKPSQAAERQEEKKPVEEKPVVNEATDFDSWSGVLAFWLVVIGLAQTSVFVLQLLAFRKQARFTKKQANFMRDVLSEMETRTIMLTDVIGSLEKNATAPKKTRKKKAAVQDTQV